MATLAAYDRRRVNAPDTLPVKRTASSSSTSRGREQSGRQSPYPIHLQTGLIQHANGSVYLEAQHVKIACAVYGPRQAKPSGGTGVAFSDEADVNVDVRLASFATPYRRRKPGRDTEAPAMAASIRSALLPSIRLDLLPKSNIDVYITILEANVGLGMGNTDDEEACAAAATTAASCALADAGIQLWALVVGSYGVWNRDGFLVDATHNEAQGAHASLVLWSMPALGSICNVEQQGGVRVDELEEVCFEWH